MGADLTAIVLPVLVLATALNLFLTLRLAGQARRRWAPSEPQRLEPGQPIPAFEAEAVGGRPLGSETLRGRASVLVFLSSGCPACRERIPELEALLPAMAKVGVALWIMGAKSTRDVTVLLQGTPLEANILALGNADRVRLNPLAAAPLYVFIDDQLIVQASSYVGDETWRLFVGQMQA